MRATGLPTRASGAATTASTRTRRCRCQVRARIERDFEADGVIDAEQLLHYEDGRLVQERNSFGGRVLSVVDYLYDDDGRLETKRWDTHERRPCRQPSSRLATTRTAT